MNNCNFCNGKMIKADNIGNGIKTMKTIIDGLISVYEMDKNNDKTYEHANGGIMLKDGNALAFDNSSGEYAEMKVRVRYCPFCGKELKINEQIHE